MCTCLCREQNPCYCWRCSMPETQLISSIIMKALNRLAGTRPCDLKLEGADKLLENLAGGLDGTYAVWSCENGRPLYKRKDSPVGRMPPSSHNWSSPLSNHT